MTSTTMQVDPSNAEQARIWDAGEGEYWATHVEYYDRSVATYQERFFDAASIRPSDHVLDIGCGNGETTRYAARLASTGSALGIDLSARMIERARALAADAGITNVAFEQADAQIHPFDSGTFNVAISRTGAMFFGDPEEAFRNIARALRSGGRFVSLHWQGIPENEWFVHFITALAAGRDLPQPSPNAPSPFALADPDRTKALLTAAGFIDIVQTPVSGEFWIGVDADDAQRFILGFLGWVLDGLDDAGRARAVDNLHATLVAHETDNGVVYNSAAWLVTARKQAVASSTPDSAQKERLPTAETTARRRMAAFNAKDSDAFEATESAQIEFVIPGGLTLHGHDQVRGYLQTMWTAFPDAQVRPLHLLSAEDCVATEATITGTHQGVLRTPPGEISPTGRSINLRQATVLRIVNGLATSEHLYFDPTEMMAQLGLGPAPTT